MYGTLFGVGIGPGDPELLTLKAVRLIQDCPVIAVPGKKKEDTVAFQIASQVIGDLCEKECIEIEMPMTKKTEILARYHEKGAGQIMDCLKTGKNVAFLTLGDPTIYSTYLYIHKRITEEGYHTEIVNGIPSFCAVAARFNIGLVEQAEMLHVIPASYQIEDALEMPGVKVLMKAGKKLSQVRQVLKARDCQVVMIENCGMKNEKVYYSIDEIPETAGYYSLLIVK